jgi:hypothetical protein
MLNVAAEAAAKSFIPVDCPDLSKKEVEKFFDDEVGKLISSRTGAAFIYSPTCTCERGFAGLTFKREVKFRFTKAEPGRKK